MQQTKQKQKRNVLFFTWNVISNVSKIKCFCCTHTKIYNNWSIFSSLSLPRVCGIIRLMFRIRAFSTFYKCFIFYIGNVNISQMDRILCYEMVKMLLFCCCYCWCCLSLFTIGRNDSVFEVKRDVIPNSARFCGQLNNTIEIDFFSISFRVRKRKAEKLTKTSVYFYSRCPNLPCSVSISFCHFLHLRSIVELSHHVTITNDNGPK